MAAVLVDLWPVFGLVLSTPRLELRLPSEDALARLALVAADGVHGPDKRPFLTPWTEGTPEDRARAVLQDHWSQLASWSVDDWRLGLGVFLRSGEPIGLATLRARDFRVRREVSTSSWLGRAHQSQGYGTEARTALLTLAFDRLGATDAVSEVFVDNVRSQGVSRKLGYERDGISRDRRGDEVLVSDRLRLTVDRWRAVGGRVRVEVSGFEPAASMFG